MNPTYLAALMIRNTRPRLTPESKAAFMRRMDVNQHRAEVKVYSKHWRDTGDTYYRTRAKIARRKLALALKAA